jgi:hypothetical protein
MQFFALCMIFLSFTKCSKIYKHMDLIFLSSPGLLNANLYANSHVAIMEFYVPKCTQSDVCTSTCFLTSCLFTYYDRIQDLGLYVA